MLLQQISRTILPATARNVVAAALCSIVIATILRALIDPLLPPGVPYFTYWIAVDAATIVAGWRAGAIAIVLSTLLGWYIWLPPRYSFEITSSSLAVVIVYLILATLQMLLAALMRSALRRLELANRERELLVSELAHRLKNQLTIFGSIASATLRHTHDTKDADRKLSGRLAALSAALDLAVSHDQSAIQLPALVTAVVRPLAPADDRLIVQGPPLEIASDRAQSFALVLHELATNALKYGAWRDDRGTITVDWSGSPTQISFSWKEQIQQGVRNGSHKGFGSALIERGIEGAQVEHMISDHSRTVVITAPLHMPIS